MLAARDGYALSLIREGFMVGRIRKDEYESALRAYHERQTEMKSEAMRKAVLRYLDPCTKIPIKIF